VIRIATRGSALARAQAGIVASALAAAGTSSELVIVETAGDRRAPDTEWGEGAFVVAIEQALLDGRADVAVHSAKDMPTNGTPGLMVAAYHERADPRDVLVVREADTARTLDTLPRGSRVGTDSPRRTAFLLARRPDLLLHPLHGNVDTRLRRLDEGQTDALVLAAAGLHRLGRADRITQVLDYAVALPAPGQGALAVQVRAGDERTAGLVFTLDHQPTRIAVEAERAFLAATGGGCRAPIGALGQVESGLLVLAGARARPDGTGLRRAEVRGPVGTWMELSEALARQLTPRVLVTRAAGQSLALSAALGREGLQAVEVPTIAIEPVPNLAPVLARLRSFDWAVVTSVNGARAVAGAELSGARWAAVGAATLAALGVSAFVPSEPSSEALAAELPISHGERVVVFQADRAGPELAIHLRARGAHVEEVTAYRTVEGPSGSRRALADALSDGLDSIAFTSGSTVRGLMALVPPDRLPLVQALPVVCIGRPTARVAQAVGFATVTVSSSTDPDGLATAVASVLR
jgi:hydroxymethylbilane synthase